jgi:hypothetical protein
MTVTEKVAYLKGLAEGLALDEAKPETKIINAMLDVLDELALTVSDLEDGLDIFSEQLDAVDEDLDELEEFVYECDCCDDDDCDCDCCCGDDCDCDCIEAICPGCGADIALDLEDFDNDAPIICSECGAELAFDLGEEDEDLED